MSRPELRDKVVIVTGASRGIGRAIALRLAREGARVEAVARNRDLLDALRREEEAVTPRVCDVTSEPEVRKTVKAVLEERGRLDVLINNAGTGVFRPIEETSYEDFRRVFEVNAGGTFLFSREVIGELKRRGGGDIINIASVVGIKGYPLQTAYGASKHAVVGLTKALAAEVHEHGIRVRSICPGGVDTDLIGEARPDLERSGLMKPEDMADIVVFLLTASPRAVIDTINVRRRGSAPWF